MMRCDLLSEHPAGYLLNHQLIRSTAETGNTLDLLGCNQIARYACIKRYEFTQADNFSSRDTTRDILIVIDIFDTDGFQLILGYDIPLTAFEMDDKRCPMRSCAGVLTN